MNSLRMEMMAVSRTNHCGSRGDLGTFVVQVQHNENNSWQGRITCLENQETLGFRSAFDMLRQMESIIGPIGGEVGPVWKQSNTKEADNI